MCALKSLMSQVLSNTSVKVFRMRLCPTKVLLGVGTTPPPAPYSPAYDTTFPKLYMTCNSITCSTLFVSLNF